MAELAHAQDHQAHAPRGLGTPTLRLRLADDEAGIVEIYTQQEADSTPLTITRYRAEHAEQATNGRGEQWVAVVMDRVVGVGEFSPAWWTGHPGSNAVQIRIDQSYQRQGLGADLYNLLLSRLAAQGATRLLCWVRADAEDGRRFAARQGFRETWEVLEECRLCVPQANIAVYEGLEGRLGRAGLRIASLAELGAEYESLLRALQQLWTDAGDGPLDPERLHASFSSWRREVLDAPGLSPETHWLALEGERPVGMTFLKRLCDDAAENDYTGVASTYRGRGIAPALKLRAIAWAQAQGVRWFYTSSEIGNSGMIAINSRLGYQPGARRLEVARDVP